MWMMAVVLIGTLVGDRAALAAEPKRVEVTGLRCEYLKEPLGIDVAKPQLSWRIDSERRSERQTAYQVLVATDAKLLAKDQGDLWDSGKVVSDQNLHVAYDGKELASRQQCYWKVRIWSAQEREPSAWSGMEKWTMGLLTPADWQARWISASQWFMEPKLRPMGFIAIGSPSWAQVELDAPARIDTVKLYPHTAETFPLRFRIEADDDINFNHPKVIADCSGEDFNLDEKKVVEFPGQGITAQRVRILILKPAVGKSNKSIIRQMEVWSAGRNAALTRRTLESGCSWESGHSVFMVDGMPSANDGATCPDDACSTQAAPLLRKVFSLVHPLRRATLYYAAHGLAEVSINGARVDTVFGPRFSDYTKRIYYCTVDVTRQLRQGDNVVGATLGNGFFSPPGRGFGERHNGRGQPRLLVQLEVELADGTRKTIVSDESWRWARSEIVSNDMWRGYTEDRRLAQPDWDKPGFKDEAWRPVGLVESLGGKLCLAREPGVRIWGRLKPSRVEGNTAFFDTLSTGWPHLEIKNGEVGQTISMKGDWGVVCNFTLAAKGPAQLEPRFVWGSGPTKLTVTGLKEPLTTENVWIQQVGADFKNTGSFHCSNPLLNELHEAVLLTHRNYCIDYPADPMREKQGWTQDAQNFFNTAAYLTDVDAFYRQWWRDMADNQRANGLLGTVLPCMGQVVNDWNCPWWSGMICWLPWEHYLYYGDQSFLKEAYEPMRKYVDYLDYIASIGAGLKPLDFPDPHHSLDRTAASERILIWNGANDWQNPKGKGGPNYLTTGAGPLVTMAGWYHCANIVSKTAKILGMASDGEKYAAMAKDIARRTNEKFLNTTTGRYGNQEDNQTAQVLPLALGMVPSEIRLKTFQQLIETIHACKDHHNTGFVALLYLLQILAESPQSELANRIVNQQDYPSWKTLVHHGVLAEGWDGGGAQMPSCGGAVGMWLYQSVLGIRPDPAGPGFKKFILNPQPDPATGLTSAEGWYDSPYGRIVSNWKLVDGRISMDVTIPPNTQATVYVPVAPKPGEGGPAQAAAAVMESGKPAAQVDGVKFLKMENGSAVYEVGSGSYRFSASR
jgi:alpha-L-rhamnosidase